jgi:hypothetical protein
VSLTLDRTLNAELSKVRETVSAVKCGRYDSPVLDLSDSRDMVPTVKSGHGSQEHASVKWQRLSSGQEEVGLTYLEYLKRTLDRYLRVTGSCWYSRCHLPQPSLELDRFA